MRIVRILSFVFDYHFFQRINSLISWLVTFSVNRKLRKSEGVSKFTYPSIIQGEENIEIGKNFQAGKGFRIQAIRQYKSQTFNPKITFGDNVIINPNCQIVSINKISLGNNVLIASNVFISDHSHGMSDFTDINIGPADRLLESKGEINIGSSVWIGQNVSILANVSIGDNVIIGANSVVTKDIPSNCVVVGSPARIIKTI